MELRGYDHYEVTLGDEIRGERASMGKSIADVERDLRIRRDLLLAIENCDLAGVANPSLLPGYVRSYARYLGMDVEDFYARFCAESGFVPPRLALDGGSGGRRSGPIGKRLAGSPFDQSRFAVTPAQTRFSARVSLGALVSAAGLVLLMGGLGYGGYAVLQNIQRVGLAPLPEAPDVIAVAPEIPGPGAGDTADAPPSPSDYLGNGALAAVYAAEERGVPLYRDGPISAIDPKDYGVYAGAGPEVAPRIAENEPGTHPGSPPPIDSADDAIRAAREREAEIAAAQREMAERLAELKAEAAASVPEGPRGIAIQVTGKAWIRVRNGDRAIIREGILEAGERYVLPERVLRGTLRAGNAGDVYVLVDGKPFGPLGRPGGVVKNLSLAPEDIRREHAEADPASVLVAGGAEAPGPRAAAD